MSSIASGRVSPNSAVSSSGDEPLALAALGDRAGHQVAADRPLLAAARAAARDEAPVLQLDHVEHALLEPLGRHVLRVHAEPLGERIAPRRELLAHRVRRGERMLRRDVVAVRGQPAEIRGALLDQRQPPVRQVGRDLDAHVRHQPRGIRARAARMSSSEIGVAQSGQRQRVRRDRRRSLRRVGDLAPAPARSSAGAARSSGGSPPGCGRTRAAPPPAPRATPRAPPASSPMPTRMPLVNGILSSPAARIVSSRRCRMLGGRPLVHHQVRVHRLEHQALRGGDLAQARQVVAREHAEVGVRKHPALERPLARPGHVGGEVARARTRQAGAATSAFTSGLSPVSTSSSFTPRREASSSIRSTSSGAYRCARCVANAQYLQ